MQASLLCVSRKSTGRGGEGTARTRRAALTCSPSHPGSEKLAARPPALSGTVAVLAALPAREPLQGSAALADHHLHAGVRHQRQSLSAGTRAEASDTASTTSTGAATAAQPASTPMKGRRQAGPPRRAVPAQADGRPRAGRAQRRRLEGAVPQRQTRSRRTAAPECAGSFSRGIAAMGPGASSGTSAPEQQQQPPPTTRHRRQNLQSTWPLLLPPCRLLCWQQRQPMNGGHVRQGWRPAPLPRGPQ